MTVYVGKSPNDESVKANRYFYGLRRDSAGNLYFGRFDQQKGSDSLTINNPGDPEDNWEGFAIGEDFFEGRGLDHELTYANINYEQYRWDERLLSYYINSNGELVLKFGDRVFPTDV
jgi:hypothetical protein